MSLPTRYLKPTLGMRLAADNNDELMPGKWYVSGFNYQAIIQATTFEKAVAAFKSKFDEEPKVARPAKVSDHAKGAMDIIRASSATAGTRFSQDLVGVFADAAMRGTAEVLRRKGVKDENGAFAKVSSKLKELLPNAFKEARDEMKAAMEANMGEAMLKTILGANAMTVAIEAVKQADVGAQFAVLNVAKLTPAEESSFNKAFSMYVEEGIPADQADKLAWDDLVEEFPRLKGFDGALSQPPSTQRLAGQPDRSGIWIVEYHSKTRGLIEKEEVNGAETAMEDSDEWAAESKDNWCILVAPNGKRTRIG